MRITGWTPNAKPCSVDDIRTIEEEIYRNKYDLGKKDVDIHPLNRHDQQRTGWIKLDLGKKEESKTIIVDNLDNVRGCTIVAAFTSSGMMAQRLWESQPLVPETGNCSGDSLHPGQSLRSSGEYIEAFGEHIANDCPDYLNQGRAVIVTPRWTGHKREKNPGDKHRYGSRVSTRVEDLADEGSEGVTHRYDAREWTPYDNAGIEQEPKLRYPGVIPEKIRNELRDATNFDDPGQQISEVLYWPVDNLTAAIPVCGTFVMLHQPDYIHNNVKHNRVQIWSDGEPVFSDNNNEGIIWPHGKEF